jgi:DNA-binding NarL/FixJ family response regulator
MRILLVDDHTVVRRGLKQILAEEFKRAVFGEARNAQEALDLVGTAPWNIVVLDITLPGRSGLDVMREIKKQRPRLPVLVLSIHPENQFAVRVLKLGAAGYMTKESAAEELVQAVKKVLAGGRYVSRPLAETLATNLSSDAAKPPQELLSDREFQVLRLIAAGRIVSEIARELALSVKTISTYRGRILEKMGLRNNAELMHYAMQHQLVDMVPAGLRAP